MLALAALTSTISLHEVVTAYLHEEFKMTRKKAAWIVTILCTILGIISSLSLGIWKDYTIGGLVAFDAFDFVTAKLMMPIGGLLIAVFAGWYLDKKIVWEEITNNGILKPILFKMLMFLLKYVSPIAIIVIFINELGFLK